MFLAERNLGTNAQKKRAREYEISVREKALKAQRLRLEHQQLEEAQQKEEARIASMTPAQRLEDEIRKENEAPHFAEPQRTSAQRLESERKKKQEEDEASGSGMVVLPCYDTQEEFLVPCTDSNPEGVSS